MKIKEINEYIQFYYKQRIIGNIKMSEDKEFFMDGTILMIGCCSKKQEAKHPNIIMVLRMWLGFIIVDVISAFVVIVSTVSVSTESQFQKLFGLYCVIFSLLIVELLFLIVITCLSCFKVVNIPQRRKIIFAVFKLFSAAISMGILLCTCLSMDKEEWHVFIKHTWWAFILLLLNLFIFVMTILEIIMIIILYFFYRKEKYRYIELVV